MDRIQKMQKTFTSMVATRNSKIKKIISFLYCYCTGKIKGNPKEFQLVSHSQGRHLAVPNVRSSSLICPN
jgi:hypothetical protein